MRAGGEGARCRYRAGCRSVAGSELLLHWDRRTPIAKGSAKKKNKLRPQKELFTGENGLPLPLVMSAPSRHFETHLSHLAAAQGVPTFSANSMAPSECGNFST